MPLISSIDETSKLAHKNSCEIAKGDRLECQPIAAASHCAVVVQCKAAAQP